MMTLSTLAAQMQRFVQASVAFVLAPLEYLRELLGLAVMLGLFLGILNTAATALKQQTGPNNSALETQRNSITRLTVVASPLRICFVRNHGEILTIDIDQGHEQFLCQIPAAEFLQLNQTGQSWGYLTYRIPVGYEWWNSLDGSRGFATDGPRILHKSMSLAAHCDAAAVLDLHNVIRIWRPNADGDVETSAQFNVSDADSIHLSPDGKTLALRCPGNQIRILDALTGIELRPAVPHSDLATSTGWSNDSSRFLVGFEEGAIQLIDIESNRPPEWIDDLTSYPSALTADGENLIVGTSTGQLICYCQGKRTWMQHAHRGNIRTLVIAEDLQQIVCGATDGKISIRNLATGDLVRELDQ